MSEQVYCCLCSITHCKFCACVCVRVRVCVKNSIHWIFWENSSSPQREFDQRLLVSHWSRRTWSADSFGGISRKVSFRAQQCSRTLIEFESPSEHQHGVGGGGLRKHSTFLLDDAWSANGRPVQRGLRRTSDRTLPRSRGPLILSSVVTFMVYFRETVCIGSFRSESKFHSWRS